MKTRIFLLLLCACVLSTCDKGITPIPNEPKPYDPTTEECFWPGYQMPYESWPPFKFDFCNTTLSPDKRYLAALASFYVPYGNGLEMIVFNLIYDLQENRTVVKDFDLYGGKFSWDRTGNTMVSSKGQIWRRGWDHFENIGDYGHAITSHYLSWSPTSDYLYFVGTSAAGKRGLHRIHNANGALETLFEIKYPAFPFDDFDMINDNELVFLEDSSHYVLNLGSMTYRRLPTPFDNSKERQQVLHDSLKSKKIHRVVYVSYNHQLNKMAAFYGSILDDPQYNKRRVFGIGMYDFATNSWRRIWEIPFEWFNGYRFNVTEGIQLMNNGNVLVNLYCTSDSTYTTWELSGTTGRKVKQWTNPTVNYLGN